MTMKSLLLAIVMIWALTLISTAGEPTTKPTSQPAAAVEDDVFESGFRYQFEHNVSAQKQNAAVYYLSLPDGGKNDPGDAFMKRFAGHGPPVRKVSERKATVPTPRGLEHPAGFPEKQQTPAERGTESGTSGDRVAATRQSIDPSLGEVVKAWPGLPMAIRVGILALIRTSNG